MKLLSVAIPCYNSAAYMRNAIESLLPAGEDIEIIVVDDGSQKDNTLDIAKEYQEKYPTIVKAVHQENGGHGQAVNTGLANATGAYFKVVDSDDWADAEALPKVMSFLRSTIEDGKSLDMLICNYIYDKQGKTHKKVIHYRNAMPVGEYFTWSDIKHFKPQQLILMHSVFYRTKVLRDCGLQLPMHTFYVDNIFVYEPFPSVETMYYLDVNFYHYFIGREDQSVNEKVMMGRIDQQIKVTKLMIEAHDLSKEKSKKRRNYMLNYLTMMMMISSVFLIKIGDEEALAKKAELWQYLKKSNRAMYKMVHRKFFGWCMFLPGKGGRKVIVFCYKVAQRIYGFN